MLAGFVAFCVLALVVAMLFAYCGRQWQALQSKLAYPNPEEAMFAFVRLTTLACKGLRLCAWHRNGL